MVMIDAKTGKVIANAPICSGTDAAAYDPQTNLGLLLWRRPHCAVHSTRRTA